MHYFYLKAALSPAIVCLNFSNLGSSDKPVQHRMQSMMNIEFDSIPISLISLLSDHFDLGFQKACETKNFPSKITSIRVRKRLQMLVARGTDVVSMSLHIDDCQSCPACPLLLFAGRSSSSCCCAQEEKMMLRTLQRQ